MRRSAAVSVAVATVFGLLLAGAVVTPASATAVVSGHVSLGSAGSPAGAGEVRVSAWVSDWGPSATTLTDASGAYTLPLESRAYKIEFEYLGTGNYASEWSGDAPIYPMATWVDVTTTPVIDSVLSEGGVISGTIQVQGGAVPDGSTVTVSTWHSWFYGTHLFRRVDTTVDVAADGTYSFTGLWPGEYSVRFYGGGYDRWWHGKPWESSGDRVTLAPGDVRDDVDFDEMAPLWMQFDTTCNSCGSLFPANWTVRLEAYDAESDLWRTADFTHTEGPVGVLPYASFFVDYPGQYRALAFFNSPNGFGIGRSAEFTVPEATGPITFALTKPTTERIQGPDRFAVAAAIAQRFEPGLPVVYVANGQNFPDALSAGPAAVHQGGLLLIVNPTNIPAVIAAELTRLHPEKIVIVGGPNSVSPVVEAQLGAYADTVVRIGGADRYEASRNVADYAWGTTDPNVVYLATGVNFPDALSAGGAAARDDAPVITVYGLASAADTPTLDVLERLGPEDIAIVGGPASVTESYANSLTSITEFVSRSTGASRYEASVAVNLRFEYIDTVYLAVGTKFPDALTGGPLAAANGAPLIIVPPTCVPGEVIQYILDRGVQHVVLLGGPASLAPSVASLTRC